MIPPRIIPPMMPAATAPPLLRTSVRGGTGPDQAASSAAPAAGLNGNAETDLAENGATLTASAENINADLRTRTALTSNVAEHIFIEGLDCNEVESESLIYLN